MSPLLVIRFFAIFVRMGKLTISKNFAGTISLLAWGLGVRRKKSIAGSKRHDG
jgi:hypothetical protein